MVSESVRQFHDRRAMKLSAWTQHAESVSLAAATRSGICAGSRNQAIARLRRWDIRDRAESKTLSKRTALICIVHCAASASHTRRDIPALDFEVNAWGRDLLEATRQHSARGGVLVSEHDRSNGDPE